MFLHVAILTLFVSAFADEGQREVILFQKADTNQDDLLTRAELDDIFLLFDANNDSEIRPAEFVKDWVDVFAIGAPVEAQALFTRADINDDGVIDAKDIPGIFTFFDTNGDGSVDISEFLTHWGALKKEAPDSIDVSVDITG